MERTTSFGYWLRRRRKALDLTQEQLARLVGCAVGTIKKLEGDERRPSRQFAERLIDLLAIPPEERAAFLKAARAELASDQLDLDTQPISMAATPTSAALLPTGTVTFLFTDIADSTTLWARHPNGMRAALARHDALLRAAIERHGGAVFKTVGDAFHAAFVTATDALAAALAAQRALQAEAWDEFSPDQAQLAITVRMALHTGTAEVREGDYFGHTLNRIARLLTAGHGSQILLSAATWELVRDHLPPDVALRDLGAHWLKSLPRPEQIYQLIAPDLPSDFPPLVSLDRPTTNLPAQPTAFIGREREVAAVGELLRRADVRLVTLTGPGGTGKTRLALQVASELLDASSPPLPPQRERGPGGEGLFPDGVWFVNLAPINDPGLLAATIAQTFGVREIGEQPIQEVVKSYLRAKRLLLLLDNFEQIAEAAPLVAELLAIAPGLTVLVTSRMPLHLSGEHEYAVPPLALPDPQHLPPELAHLAQYEAVRLFIERAQAVKADFAVTNKNAPAVAEICARLDGLPLAIELAAARVKLFPPQALLTRLGNRLKLLTGGAHDLPARQQTIRNTIDWSYQLLNTSEQTLFARLGVFVGGCTLEAAEAVCTADADLPMEIMDGIAALLDQSLLRQEEGVDGEPRFTMLETIREYASERMAASGQAETTQRQHATYFLALAERTEPELLGPEQGGWLKRLEGERDNLLSTLNWALDQRDAEPALRLSAALWRFWDSRGPLSEGRRWLEAALGQGESLPTALRAKALSGAGYLAADRDTVSARIFFEESLTISQVLGDKRGIALALLGLGNIAVDEVQAIALYEESLAIYRELDDKSGIAWVLTGLGGIALSQGNDLQSSVRYEESLTLYRELGDKGGIAWALHALGEIAIDQGDNQRAAELFRESLALSQDVGAKALIAWALSGLGTVALSEGDNEEATVYYERALAIYREYGHKPHIAWLITNLGNLAIVQRHLEQAAIFLEEGIALYQDLGDKAGIAYVLVGFAGLAATQGQPKKAARLWGAVETLEGSGTEALYPIERSRYDRYMAATRAQLDEATFAAAWEAGRALTLEQAIEEALGQ